MPTDIFSIKDDKSAIHLTDPGTWQVTDQLLTIQWVNGYRLTIDTTQTGATVIAKSYPPRSNHIDVVKFSKKRDLAPAPTFPIKRTLTTADGRKLEGTILSKDVTSIQFRRTTDGKEFTLELTKLSAEDQAFISKLTAIPVKKPRLMLVANDPTKLNEILEKSFEVTLAPTELLAIEPSGTPDGSIERYIHLGTDINSFDLIWVARVALTEFKTNKQLSHLAKINHLLIVQEKQDPVTYKQFVLEEPYKFTGVYVSSKPYMHSDKNFISYSSTGEKYRKGESEIIETKPEIYDQVIAEALRILGNVNKPEQN